MKIMRTYWVFLLILFANTCFADASHQNIVGRIETGMLMDQAVVLEIKMDTGAFTSSLSAHDIKIFKKDGEEWVSFIIDNTHIPKEHRFEYPLKRIVRIKKRQSEMTLNSEGYERRPVIEMELCLGKEVERIEINLNDRSNFLYPMLLGRSAMHKFGILIDPSETFTLKPQCAVATSPKDE